MEKKKLKLHELHDLEWREAVIVFTEGSFKKPYSLLERSYQVSKDNKYFDPTMLGRSLYGDCLDGKDKCVRLDVYMYGDWTVDYCYIIEEC